MLGTKNFELVGVADKDKKTTEDNLDEILKRLGTIEKRNIQVYDFFWLIN